MVTARIYIVEQSILHGNSKTLKKQKHKKIYLLFKEKILSYVYIF